ncbi:MAG TPA: hypothetical protein VM802_26855 [Chitinophaga sp.]|uniref:hypothetical protein n=1 Tax=Chitinophaga sp. TaxID=1869181 RepID=UPI002BA4B497|nr:hypothetical protein [Chitinophaga sp.]HVI48517.1 hypothetical protein [Chitinophaga sp.]
MEPLSYLNCINMSLLSFQRALTDLIASPQLCVEARHHPESILSRYDLTILENMRLRTVLYQKGMSVSCTLYRVNRITPVYTLMPYTCLLLGDLLVPLAEECWSEYSTSGLQFKHEIEIFTAFLQQKLNAGSLHKPYLQEILAMEAAINELKFLQKDMLMKEVYEEATHPLIRLIPFEHDPEPLLEALSNMNIPAVEKKRDNYLLMIDYRGDEMLFSTLPGHNQAAC